MVYRYVMLCCVLLAVGCTTTRTSNTPRTGMEQLLISNAVDQALSNYDFRGLNGASVFVEEKYLDGVIDKGYVTGTIRDRILRNGARLVSDQEKADVVVELRSGGVGTDITESFVGMPGVALPGPMPVELPEVKLWNRDSQLGTAKIGILAYDAKQGTLVDLGGASLARSSDSNWYVVGVGPFKTGTVRDEVAYATGSADPGVALTNVVAELPGTRR